MPRGVKAGSPAKPVRRAGKIGTAAAKTMAKPRAARAGSAIATPRRTPPPPTLPKVSKDELRAQVDKLQRANAVLRTKNKEAARLVKSSGAEIAELEERVAELERQVAAQAAKIAAAEARAVHGEAHPAEAAPAALAKRGPQPTVRKPAATRKRGRGEPASADGAGAPPPLESGAAGATAGHEARPVGQDSGAGAADAVAEDWHGEKGHGENGHEVTGAEENKGGQDREEAARDDE